MIIDAAVRTIIDKQPFFTSLVLALEPIEDKDIPTLGTDGRHLFFNPDFFKQFKEDEQSALILHETLHCAFSHMWRVGKRDQMKWNIATDFAINPMVDENFKLPKGALLDSKYYGMSAEAIYDALPKDKKNKQQDWCDKGHWGDKNKKGGGRGKNKKKEQGKGMMNKIKESMGVGKEVKLKKKEVEWAKIMNSSQTKEKWKKLFDKTFLENYGNAPDSIKRVIEKEYYVPTIDWASLVSGILSEDASDYSFNNPDRRFAGAPFVLPGMYSIDRLKDVVFAYDTSGSITPEDLHAYYVETMRLFENFSNLAGWIAVCDATLHHFTDITHQATFDEFRFSGGGGTDFRPVFDKVKEQSIKPKALFYFTDTFGSFPDEDPGFPVFWLVRSHVGDNSERTVPFGTVIKFMPNKIQNDV